MYIVHPKFFPKKEALSVEEVVGKTCTQWHTLKYGSSSVE